MKKLLLVDDSSNSLENVLPLYDFDVTVAKSKAEAINILDSETNFDIVLVDIMVSNNSGPKILESIRKNSKIKTLPIIAITKLNDTKKIITALKSGADDYIVKPIIVPLLLAKIETIFRRCLSFNNDDKSNNVKIIQENKLNSLTEREKDVLLLVAKGKTNKEIAENLFVSLTTVKSYLYSIYKKLEIKNRAQAVLFATQMNNNKNNIKEKIC